MSSLPKRVGISAPPCLRRVQSWKKPVSSAAIRALLNAPALGYDLVAFCMVGLKHQSDANLKAFAKQTAKWPLVREAWMVSGRVRFSVAMRRRKPCRLSGFRY